MAHVKKLIDEIREVVREELEKWNAATEYLNRTIAPEIERILQEEGLPLRDEQYLVSMDEDGVIVVSDREPIEWRDGWYFGYATKAILELMPATHKIPGLQEGMLCLAEKHGDTYKIVKVLECNLDIDVDWRETQTGKIHRHCKVCDCFSKDYHTEAPYLPDTDVQLGDCDFNERKRGEESAQGDLRIRCKEISSDVLNKVLYPMITKFLVNATKLITLDILKERGASEGMVKWYKKTFYPQFWEPHNSPTLQILLGQLVRKGLKRWLEWSIENLWDYQCKS